MATMEMTLGQQAQMEMRPSPSLIAFTQVLALSAFELQQAIEQEASENPALEIKERTSCPICGEQLVQGICYACLRRDSWASANGSGLSSTASAANGEEEFDPLTLVASQMSLSEALLRDLFMVIDPEDQFIAEYLTGSLDERGFLDATVEEIAATLHVDEKRVQQVLDLLRSVGPLGIAAADVRECLLLQLDNAEHNGNKPHRLARGIIDRYLTELGEGKFAQIANALSTNSEEVQRARNWIRTNLRPFPIADVPSGSAWSQPSRTPFIAPDVVVRAKTGHPGQWEVEVVGSQLYYIRINPVYRQLADNLAHGGLPYNEEEVGHIRTHIGRAQQFLAHLRERRQTLLRVAEYVFERQKDFLAHGIRSLQPLTRAEVAIALNLHESTVSRATADKYVLLPNRHVMPFSAFFKSQLGVQDVLRELIENEVEPLTDTELAQLLSDRGFVIARRTVAKYREQMGILPSTLR